MYRRRFRVRRYKRRAYRKKGGSLWNLAKKAASGVVKYYLNPEYKFLDNNANTTITNTGTILSSQSLIAQGDDATSRDGNSIKVTSWLFRATMDINGTNNARVRIVAFIDASSNGVVPLISDVFQSTLGNLIISPMNRVNGKRFKVLFDRSFILDNDDPKKTCEVFKKMQHHIHYLDATASTSSLGQGPIYIALISDQPLANAPSFSMTSRMRFLDN